MPECVPCCTTALAWARSFSWLLDRQHWASSPDEAKQLSETEDKDNKFNSRCHFIEHKDSCLARLQCFAMPGLQSQSDRRRGREREKNFIIGNFIWLEKSWREPG